MAAKFGDGFAVDADPVRAAEQAAGQAVRPLHPAAPDLAFVFVCHDDPDQVEQAGQRASEVLGARTVVGCSAGGVIGAGQAAEGVSAASAWAAVLPSAHLRSFHLEVIRTPQGMAVVGLPSASEDAGVMVLLADPWSFPVDGFVEQSNEVLSGLGLVGGLATGARGAGSTRLFLDGRTVQRGAVGVLLGPRVRTRAVVSQGCRPVGPAMTVTAADGNVLLELAGVPALPKLQEVVETLTPDDQALVGVGVQLGIAMDEYVEDFHQGDFLVRGIVGADRDRQALVVGDVVPVGRTVQFQVRDPDAADADLGHVLARLAADRTLPGVAGALLFSCNGRGEAMFANADHDVVALRRVLGASPVAGFFAGGEIGPVGGRNHVHGLTASILAFGPDDAG